MTSHTRNQKRKTNRRPGAIWSGYPSRSMGIAAELNIRPNHRRENEPSKDVRPPRPNKVASEATAPYRKWLFQKRLARTPHIEFAIACRQPSRPSRFPLSLF